MIISLFAFVFLAFNTSAKSCGDPGSPSNGRKLSHVFTFKSEVEFECNSGYKLVGEKFRHCQSNQKWSGRMPTCKRKDSEINQLNSISYLSSFRWGEVGSIVQDQGSSLIFPPKATLFIYILIHISFLFIHLCICLFIYLLIYYFLFMSNVRPCDNSKLTKAN